MKKAMWWGLVSLACAAVGLLLIFEVVRPFRDLAKDGPLAMISWSVGTIAAVSCFLAGRAPSRWRILGLLLNLVPSWS